MKIRPVSVAALILALAACSAPDDPAPLSLAEFSALRGVMHAPQAVRAAAAAIVRISTATHSGTGTFVGSDGQLLTNNHVLGAGSCAREGCFVRLTLHHELGSASAEQKIDVYAKPIRIHPELDLALLQVFTVAGGKPVAVFAPPAVATFAPPTTSLAVGTRVHVVGHPKGRLKKWSTGTVSGTEGRWITTTVFALPGSSGSPYLDDNGQIVGVLHRGSEGDDRLTPNGLNDESIGSGLADVRAALEATGEGADGLGLLRSVDAPATEEEVVLDQSVWLLAHRSSVQIGERTRTVVELLAEKCDATLVAPRFPAVDLFMEAMAPCLALPRWIECQELSGAPQTMCPDVAEAERWRNRFRKIGDALAPYDTSSWLGFRVGAVASLELTPEDESARAKTELTATLAATQPPLDLGIAQFLAYANIPSYAGVDIVEYLRSYSRIPEYQHDVYSIIYGQLWVLRHGHVEWPAVSSTIRALLVDPRVALGPHLFVEEVAYVNKIVN